MPDPVEPFLALAPVGRRVVLHPTPDGRGGFELRATNGQPVPAGRYRPAGRPVPPTAEEPDAPPPIPEG